MPNTQAHTRALEILAGCPDGATEYALEHLHGISPRVVHDLIAADLVSVTRQRVGTTRLRYTVYRLRLVDAGRKRLTLAGAES